MTRTLIQRVEVPTPSTDGPVNVFILKGDAIILIDTGPITRPGIELLKRGLHRVGAQMKHVDAVLLTQAHMDHFGMGSILNDRSNAIICGHPATRGLIEDFPAAQLRQIRAIGTYVERHGFPAALYRRVSSMDRAALSCARPVGLDVAVKDGLQMEFGNIKLRVIHTPGQTAGAVCYYEQSSRTLFAGDVIMDRPSASVFFNGHAPNKKVGLSVYLKSLNRLRKIAARQVCPGHSRPMRRIKALTHRLERRVRETQHKVLRALRHSPKTAYAVTHEISPAHRVSDRWAAFARTLSVLEQLQGKLRVRSELTARGELFHALR